MAGVPLHVSVDRGACSGYGICADLCPSVFELDDDGFAVVVNPTPRDHAAEVREAERECPEEAITVTSPEG